MKVGFKVWIEDDKGDQLVGEGLEQLLQAVAETGSINKAAARLHMSYRTAWARIKKAEKRLGRLLVSKQIGGTRGGGSRLTKEGYRLLRNYKKFHGAAEREIKKLFQEYFPNPSQSQN
ncbi:MAG TPA: LysR family transcriptional regulator [Firmicutes bacterium]|nr:LysR family transcriptional regulator [Bacillota bacterium]